MATRKRRSTRSGLVGRAVKAGRQALREAEKRVPPDLRRQVQRSLNDAEKAARSAIKQLQAQAKKASTRADVNTVLKRIDALTKQARQAVRGTGARASASGRRAASTSRRRATSTTRKVATRASTARRSASARTSTPRRSTPRRRAAAETAMPETMAPEAGGAVEMGEISDET